MSQKKLYWCTQCSEKNNRECYELELIQCLTGTPGYYQSTVGRGVSDYWKVKCTNCGYTHVADLGD